MAKINSIEDNKAIRLQSVSSFTKGQKNPEIVIYKKPNFNGDNYRTNCDIDYVGVSFNDEVYSAAVVAGTWQLYKDAGFKVALGKPLIPGYYSNLTTIIPNGKGISSIKCISI